jgi:hypothetical protein
VGAYPLLNTIEGEDTMTAAWALVFFVCTGRYECNPSYVENYNTRKECIAAIPKLKFVTQYAVCAPISKD